MLQTEETVGADWRSYDSYRTIMVRRLADAVGLDVEPSDGREASDYHQHQQNGSLLAL